MPLIFQFIPASAAHVTLFLRIQAFFESLYSLVATHLPYGRATVPGVHRFEGRPPATLNGPLGACSSPGPRSSITVTLG
jgi:hypothetical protein